MNLLLLSVHLVVDSPSGVFVNRTKISATHVEMLEKPALSVSYTEPAVDDSSCPNDYDDNDTCTYSLDFFMALP
jgi:hypothetical protein